MNIGVSKRRQDEPTPEERRRRAERGERLRQAMRDRDDISLGALARAANLNPGTVIDARDGLRATDPKTWRKLGAVLRHRHLWLQHGVGERYMTEDEAVSELAELKLQSQTKLMPVSSDGVDRWLTQWGELLSITPAEREWLHKIPWPDPACQYPDLAYKAALDTYRMMRAKIAADEDSPAPA